MSKNQHFINLFIGTNKNKLIENNHQNIKIIKIYTTQNFNNENRFQNLPRPKTDEYRLMPQRFYMICYCNFILKSNAS